MRVVFAPGNDLIFIDGELFQESDGTVRLERLYDKPEPVPGEGTLPCRTVSVDPNGVLGWRPAGRDGPYEKGRRCQIGVVYHVNDDPTKPRLIVPVQVVQ